MSFNIDIKESDKKINIVKNILKNEDTYFYVFDGIIGAGKTTYLKMLANRLNNRGVKTKLILEPVNIWNETGALKYFYEDIPKNCYEFQTLTYATRIKSVIDAIYETPDATIYLLERSIWTDRYIFMELLKPMVGELRMSMYNLWCDLWSYLLPMKINKWVLLDTSLGESISRIKNRNRDGESDIDIEYQRKLYYKHTEFYDELKVKNENVVIIPSYLMNTNFMEDENMFYKITGMVLDDNIYEQFVIINEDENNDNDNDENNDEN